MLHAMRHLILAVVVGGAALAGGGSSDGADPRLPAPTASLGIPVRDAYGQPIDVGLLILGHSTSTAGDWPGKLALALNQRTSDGRNYVVFRAITHGDGGFLWSRLAVPPGDMQYARVQASAQGTQWCEDPATGVRYS